MNLEQLQAEIAKLKAENANLKANGGSKTGIKVSTKGAVSVYGLGRFPVTLYPGQWENLFMRIDTIKAFIEANKASLSFKAEVKAE